jgi:lambda repressor-like predicted transcriptional regulator
MLVSQQVNQKDSAMHPEQIKAAVRMQGMTPAAIADKLGVTPSMVSRVIHGATVSARVRKYIATLLGKPVTELWPPVARPVMRRTRQDVRSPGSAA